MWVSDGDWHVGSSTCTGQVINKLQVTETCNFFNSRLALSCCRLLLESNSMCVCPQRSLVAFHQAAIDTGSGSADLVNYSASSNFLL